VARDIAKTRLYRSRAKIESKVEMLFADLKRIPNVTRLRLRGMNGARDEFDPLSSPPEVVRSAAHESERSVPYKLTLAGHRAEV
jgi:hypothetical protein